MLVAILLLEVCVALVSVTPSVSIASMPPPRPMLESEPKVLNLLNRLRCQLEELSARSVCGARGANLARALQVSFASSHLEQLSVNAQTLVRNLSAHVGCRRPRCDVRRSRECSLARAVWPQLHLPPGATASLMLNAGNKSVRSNTPKCLSAQLWFQRCYPPADRIKSSSSSIATLVTGAYERAASLLLTWKDLELVLNASAVRSCGAPHIGYVQSMVVQLQNRVNLRWIELLCSSHHLASFASLNRSFSRSANKTSLTALTTTTIAAEQRLEHRAEKIVAAIVRALENTANENEFDAEREFERAQMQTRGETPGEKLSSVSSSKPTWCRNVRRTVHAVVRITLAYLGEYELPLVRALEKILRSQVVHHRLTLEPIDIECINT